MSRPEIEVMTDNALRTWARWMRSPSDLRDLWYPSTSPGFSSGGISCWDDFDDSCASALAQSVDVIVNALEVTERSAVMHEYLGSVFRGREGVLEDALERAIAKLGRALLARGVF